MREQRQPAGLSEAAGVWYDEMTNLLGPVAVVSDLLAGSAAEFAELLIPMGPTSWRDSSIHTWAAGRR